MNYDEAITAAFEGMRIRHAGMQPGCYVEHVFSRGLLKCWPVASPDLEPKRTQCDFVAHADDLAATWEEVVARVQVASPLPGNPQPVAAQAAKAGWGSAAVGRALREPAPGPAIVKEWALPKSPAPVVEFCDECEYAKSACICSKPVATGWGTPLKKEPGKWGL